MQSESINGSFFSFQLIMLALSPTKKVRDHLSLSHIGRVVSKAGKIVKFSPYKHGNISSTPSSHIFKTPEGWGSECLSS